MVQQRLGIPPLKMETVHFERVSLGGRLRELCSENVIQSEIWQTTQKWSDFEYTEKFPRQWWKFVIAAYERPEDSSYNIVV